MKTHLPQEVQMNSDHHTSSWLFDSQLAPYVDAFMLHLFDRRCASNTINNYLAGLTKVDPACVLFGDGQNSTGIGEAGWRIFIYRQLI